MGKSLYVKRLFEKLQARAGVDGCQEVIIPIHGPKVYIDSLVEALCYINDDDDDNIKPTLYHIDVSQSVSNELLLYIVYNHSCIY